MDSSPSRVNCTVPVPCAIDNADHDEDDQQHQHQPHLFHSHYDVEVRLAKSDSKMDRAKVEADVFAHLRRNGPKVRNWSPIELVPVESGAKMDGEEKETDSREQPSRWTVERIVVSSPQAGQGELLSCSPADCLNSSSSSSATFHFHIYSARKGGALAEELSTEEGNEASAAIGSYQWELPCLEFEELWENLWIDGELKQDLLSHFATLQALSRAGAKSSIFPANRLVLLHGPPGTGKTTLCKALAQKIAIRSMADYRKAVFVEVNSHSLFSKWFSESGKLVQKLFEQIEELASQTDRLVFVLIDEVESLTMGRSAAFSGSDPSDSVRAVNAVLTHLDRVKHFPNALILCTSNLEHSLDPAFLDRADFVRRVGPPGERNIRAVLESCIEELIRVRLIDSPSEDWKDGDETKGRLTEIASKCQLARLSGRALRKLPLHALTNCGAARQQKRMAPNTGAYKLGAYLSAMDAEMGRMMAEGEDRKQLEQCGGGGQKEQEREQSAGTNASPRSTATLHSIENLEHLKL